jgi:hypothetical protein
MNRGFIGALCLSVTFAFLAGCGGATRDQSTIPQGLSSVHEAIQHRKSTVGDLIYGAGDGLTYVLTYPQGKLISTITEGGGDICSDSSGSVYLTVDARIDEFMHGATTPSTSFKLPGTALGCSVDPTTGNLAVTYIRTSGKNVAIFASGSSDPTLLSAANLDAESCGYDNQGNLFVAGVQSTGGYTLDELPVNDSSFTTLSITPAIERIFGRVQWDGSHITVESYTNTKKPRSVFVSRLSVTGSAGTVVGTTAIKGIKQSAFLSWIEGNRILVPFGNASHGTPNIGYWKYPAGGKPITTLKAPAGKAVFNALTISNGT